MRIPFGKSYSRLQHDMVFADGLGQSPRQTPLLSGNMTTVNALSTNAYRRKYAEKRANANKCMRAELFPVLIKPGSAIFAVIILNISVWRKPISPHTNAKFPQVSGFALDYIWRSHKLNAR